MATVQRFGTLLLLIGGLALAGLMGYALLPPVGGDQRFGSLGTEVAEVAVVFPEQNSTAWEDFRRGVLACGELGLVGEIVETRTALTVRTRGGHRVRFRWTPASGLVQTREAVERMLAAPNSLVALVGSANTALTAVLAEALRDATRNHPGNRPVLLVPWATAMRAEPLSGGSEPIPLLDIYDTATFRFGPDNQRQADLLVRFAVDHDKAGLPARVVVISDRDDPFSRDLAEAFHDALDAIVPKTPVEDRAAPSFPAMPTTIPDATERSWAESIWNEARATAAEGPTWLILPLQGEPSRRILGALRTLAPRDAATIPLRVLSGDGVGVGSLSVFAGTLPFPVWSASPGFTSTVGVPMSAGAQVMAEIVLALARAIDETVGPDGLATALRRIQIPADVLGRSIAFQAGGERAGEDLGRVLVLDAGADRVVALARRSDGGWSEPSLLAPERP